MIITEQDTDIATQIYQNSLIYQTADPGALQFPILRAIDWSGLTFAEYTLILGGPLDQFQSHEGSSIPANPDGFITAVFENALHREPGAIDLRFYENMIAGHSTQLEGFAAVLIGVALSPESQNMHPAICV